MLAIRFENFVFCPSSMNKPCSKRAGDWVQIFNITTKASELRSTDPKQQSAVEVKGKKNKRKFKLLP